MATDNTSKTIKQKDGRMLGYAEYGNPEGKPVFYFHGFPTSRLDWPLFDTDAIAARLGARVIAVDRPGVGLSDFKRGRKLLDWPDDVIELADALQVDRFAVLGISGGGPYAAVCAFKIPERLTTTAIVCGMGPAEAPGAKDGLSWILPGKSRWMRRLLLMLMAMGLRRNPDRFLSKSNEMYPERHPDKLLLAQPEVVPIVMDTSREAVWSGIGGVHHEATLYTRPWQFRLQDISMEVHLWHGEQDANVPVSVGRYVANAIPNCRAKFLPDEGHFTIARNRIEEILSILI